MFKALNALVRLEAREEVLLAFERSVGEKRRSPPRL